MNRLTELLLPYVKEEVTAYLIAEELAKKGVMVLPKLGSFQCKFEPNSVFGTMTMDGETFEVYLGEFGCEAIVMGCDLIGYQRQITLIER